MIMQFLLFKNRQLFPHLRMYLRSYRCILSRGSVICRPSVSQFYASLCLRSRKSKNPTAALQILTF